MADLMKGKRGLVMGVANDRSIAWGIARALAAEGAELAFTYQGEAFGRRVEPLAQSVGSDILVDVDVTDDASLDAAFARLADAWGRLDFVVHAIAYSDKAELTGRFIDTSRGNFTNSLAISCYSLIDVARRARPLMTDGGDAADADLPGLEQGDAVLQRHGRGQGGAGIHRALPGERPRARADPRQRHQPRAR